MPLQRCAAAPVGPCCRRPPPPPRSPLTCLPELVLAPVRLQGKRFYVQMDPRLEDAPEFAGCESATAEVQELIGEAAVSVAEASQPPSKHSLGFVYKLDPNSCTVNNASPDSALAAPAELRSSTHHLCLCGSTCRRAARRHLHRRPAGGGPVCAAAPPPARVRGASAATQQSTWPWMAFTPAAQAHITFPSALSCRLPPTLLPCLQMRGGAAPVPPCSGAVVGADLQHHRPAGARHQPGAVCGWRCGRALPTPPLFGSCSYITALLLN